MNCTPTPRNSLSFSASELMEEAVSRPSTTADSVPSMAMMVLIASRDSVLICGSGRTFPSNIPSTAPPNMTAKTTDADQNIFHPLLRPADPWFSPVK